MAIVARPKHSGLALWPALAARWLAPAARMAAVLALGIAAMVLVDAVYAERAVPGLQVAGTPVGSLDRAEVRSRLVSELARTSPTGVVTFRDGERVWSAPPGELGIEPDVDAAVDAALGFGKSGSWGERARAWAAAVRGRAEVPLTMRIADPVRLEHWMASIASGVERSPVEGEIRVTSGGMTMRAPMVGRLLDRGALVGALLAARSAGDRTIDLVARPVLPSVDSTGFDDAASAVRAITTPLEIVAGDQTVREDAAGLSTLIALELLPVRPPVATVPAGAVVPASRYRYETSLDETRVRAWIAAVAAAVDRPATNASYAVAPDGSLLVLPGHDGTKVDQAALLRAVMADLVRPAPGGMRTIVAPFVADPPAFATAEAARYASAMAPISRFTTYYPANPSRHANISTGAAQFDQLVVAPGASFSFWGLLGPVTVQRGYAYAGAIINNRSDENVIGGGLCQVSTTLFNAVARAGYQIDERHNHGYYIDRYPIGLDAAVFEPGVDFRWTNDTPYPVLVRSSGTATSVTFELWSLPVGRTVTFGAPVVRNIVAVKPDQPADPAFAAGYAVDGRDVVATRTVVAEGIVVHSDVWVSHYVPVWGGPPR